jgi:hypothetical protein
VTTITLPLSGKLSLLGRVLEAVEGILVPGPSRLVVLDDSGNKAFGREASSQVSSIRSFDESVYIDIYRGPRPDVASVYNDVLFHVKGDWLSLEDDVLPGKWTFLRLLREASESAGIGIVGAHMEDRHANGRPLCWRAVPGLSGKLTVIPCLGMGHGASLVDAIHMGCTLIRPSAWIGHVFRHRGEWADVHGQDIDLCLEAKHRRGLSTMVVWEERIGHMTTQGSLYPSALPGEPFVPVPRASDIRVSVVIPTRGRPDSLRRVLGLLKGQTHPSWEALVCHDGPSRESAGVVEEFGDHRVRYWEYDFPMGGSGAPSRNYLVRQASGSLVCFVDDDAEISQSYLATMADMWRVGWLAGFACVRLLDGDRERIIPDSREKCVQAGEVDTLCGFVDAAMARGCYWDNWGESHDARYWAQVVSYLRGAYGYSKEVVGTVRRRHGGVERLSEGFPPEDLAEIRRLASRGSRLRKLEQVFAADPVAAVTYAMQHPAGHRFEMGEGSIASLPWAAISYARHIGRSFPAVESKAAHDPRLAEDLAQALGKSWRSMGREDIHGFLEASLPPSAAYRRLP